MKILAAPDLHCYWPTFNRIGEDGTPSRLADWRRSAEALIKTAVEHKVSAALFPGDFFPNSRPAPAQVLEIAHLFSRFEQTEIPVVGCAGNHDLLGPGQLSPVDVVARMAPDGRRWGYTVPDVADLGNIRVVVLPSIKAPQTGGDPAASAQMLAENLIGIARGLCVAALRNSDSNTKVVLMGHWAISGCRMAAGNTLAATEPTLPLGDLQALPIKAAVLGHIHTPQVITDGPLVLHTGILERHDFGEEKNETGCYIIDLDAQKAEFVPLPGRRFWTMHLYDDRDVQAWLDGLIGTGDDFEMARDAIVRVAYQCSEELAAKMDHSALIKRLEQESPHQIGGIFPEIVRGERGREADITETTSPLESLQKWLAMRSDISEGLRNAIKAQAEALLKEVQAL